MLDKYDRQSVESVHEFEDKCDKQTIEEACFEALLENWRDRLEQIKVDPNTEMLFRQLRKNGLL